MKKIILTVTLIIASACSTQTTTRNAASENAKDGESEIYQNSKGCTVEKEARANGYVLYVSKQTDNIVIGFTKDFKRGTFVYCDDKELTINVIEGRKGTGIMMSCSEHQNGEAVTRGRVDIDLEKNDVRNIKIDGQVKSFFGWKQEVALECSGLTKK